VVYAFRSLFTVVGRIESVRENCVAGGRGGGGRGFVVPNKRRQKDECREFKDKRDLCYTLKTLQHKMHSKYSHKNYVSVNGNYEGDSSSFYFWQF
jgi:hypothetical protein